MQVPPPTVPIIKGHEKSDPGGHALAGASGSGSNPNKRYVPQAAQHLDSSEEEKTKETGASRLIDRSPISSETQAALLALLSEPFAEIEAADSFAELVEEATLEQTAAQELSSPVTNEGEPE